MSIKAYGVFESYANQLTLQQQIDLSFKIANLAILNKIGIKFGYNVWPKILDEYAPASNTIIFELIDHLLDNNAEVLFVGNDIKMYVNKIRVDTEESLVSRMSRIQKFFEEVFGLNEIKDIKLTVNPMDPNEYILKIKVIEFAQKIIGLYKNNWTPSVKLNISR